jgi:hypothetical protein
MSQSSTADKAETPDASTPIGEGGIPFMVTNEMRRGMADLGYTPEQVRGMTPEQIHEALKAGRRADGSASEGSAAEAGAEVDPFSRPITISLGKGADETAWIEHRMPDWSQFARWFTNHKVGPKEGPCFTPARFQSTRRANAEAEEIGVLVLDCDSGHTLAEIEAAVRAKGLAAAISSTHSHLTTTTELAAKDWQKFPNLNAAGYLVERKGMLPHIAKGATVKIIPAARRRSRRGREPDCAVFRHQPCPKFRVALLLATPWRRAEFSAGHDPAETWKAAVGWVAAELGLHHDESAVDPARLFFLPRYRKGAKPETAIIEGAACAVDWSAMAAPAYAPEAGLPPEDLDRPEDIKWVIEFLKKQAATEPAVEGAHGDETTFRVACAVRDSGVSEHTCLGLMATHYNPHCAPRWEVTGGSKSLQAKVRSAYKEKPVGTRTPRYEFRDYVNDNCEPSGGADQSEVCIRLADWLARDIPPPEFLMGELLSTTSRAMLTAPTGLGKTNFCMAVAFAMASGQDFLRWKARRPARVLYVDGEMSRRLYKQRLADAARRAGVVPDTLFALCKDDIEKMPPLNTPKGQRFIDKVIEKVGGVDFVVFDNVMSLIQGDMKDEEGWANTLPWVKRLTSRSIGQIWVHHTGHNETHQYGTSTREWQLDTSILCKRAEGADIAFEMHFPKARERAPENRQDFEPIKVQLVDDKWMAEPIGKRESKSKMKPPTPKAQKCLDALLTAISTVGEVREAVWGGEPSVTMAQWRAECARIGLFDDAKPKAQNARFSNYKGELVALGLVQCDGDFAWVAWGG